MDSDQVTLRTRNPEVGPPCDASAIINRLENEVIALDHQWRLFQSLYGRDERAHRLWTRAPITYELLARALLRDWTQLLVRLVDPATTKLGGKVRHNVSLRALDTLLDSGQEQYVAWKDELRVVEQQVARFKLGRNRMIAHMDSRTIDGHDTIPIPRLHESGEVIQTLKACLDLASTMVRNRRCTWNLVVIDIDSEVSSLLDSV